MRLKTSWVVQQLGGVNATALFFGIRPPSVSTWGEHIPLLRAYQLRDRDPALFERAVKASGKRASGRRTKGSQAAVPPAPAEATAS